MIHLKEGGKGGNKENPRCAQECANDVQCSTDVLECECMIPHYCTNDEDEGYHCNVLFKMEETPPNVAKENLSSSR